MYICLLAYSIVSVLGILAWWLISEILSPLAMGGIAGSIIPILLAIFHIGYLLYKLCTKDPIGENHEKAAVFLGMTISASAIIGIILTASVAAVFPNPIAGFTLISAITGVIATIAGFFATVAMVGANEAVVAKATPNTTPTYVKIPKEEEVDECITFPEKMNKSITYTTVEKVSSVKETAV